MLADQISVELISLHVRAAIDLPRRVLAQGAATAQRQYGEGYQGNANGLVHEMQGEFVLRPGRAEQAGTTGRLNPNLSRAKDIVDFFLAHHCCQAGLGSCSVCQKSSSDLYKTFHTLAYRTGGMPPLRPRPNATL